MHVDFHWGAMVLAAVAAFIFGFLWYGPLFGRRWAEEMGFDMDGPRPGMKEMAWPMAGNFVGQFLTAYALTWFGQSLTGHWTGWGEFHGILMVALLAWSGFFLPMGLTSVGWEERSWGFFGINMGHSLLNLILIGTMVHYLHF